jgi:hypothetical protein
VAIPRQFGFVTHEIKEMIMMQTVLQIIVAALALAFDLYKWIKRDKKKQ